MDTEPAPQTLNALRAARDAQRVAKAVQLDRITAMGTVTCADCGRPVAVATDADHPTCNYEGRVICGPCTRLRHHPHPGSLGYRPIPEPAPVTAPVQLPAFLCKKDIEEAVEPPTRWERLRASLRRIILG